MFNDELKNSDKLGRVSIKKLLLRLSIPSAIGLIVGTSYNLVDTIYVGRLGVLAITALSVVFPIQMILAGLATGVGVGTQSLISRLLGKKNKLIACQVAGNSIVLALIFGIVTSILGLFFSNIIVGLFISDSQIIEMASSYIKIILIGSFSLFFLRAGLNILRGQGNYVLPMLILVFTAILNIIIDPLLIFGIWFFPKLGIQGAAIATVFSRIISSVIILFILKGRFNELKIKIRDLKINNKLISSIAIVGVPTLMIQLVMSITIAGTNRILEGLTLGGVAIAVMGIYFKLQSIILTPALALSRSFVPVIGYNYGAKKYDRIREALKLSIIFTFLISFVAFLAFQLIPDVLIKIFNSDTTLINIGTEAFRRVNILFFTYGPAVIFISLFQGIGSVTKVFFALALRQFIAFFPILYVLTNYFGHPTLWYSFPLADILAITIGLILIIPDLKRLNINRLIFKKRIIKNIK
jgi:putative MATE family efflux protein